MSKARISLSSPDIDKLNNICNEIKAISEKTGAPLSGPIPLPNKRLKVQTRKSPGGDGKASYDRYEMRIYKKLIDLGVDERALRLIMRVPIPEEVNISVEMLD